MALNSLFRGCWLSALLGVALVLVGTFGVYQGCNLLVTLEERDSLRRWEADFGSFGEFRKRHPRSGANQKARDLDGISEKMGLPILYHYGKSPAVIHEFDREGKKEIDTITKAFREYLNAEIRKPDPEIAQWPQVCGSFVESHAGELDRFRAEILNGPSPQWDCDVDRLREAPIPGLMHLLDLQRIYLCVALQEFRAHRDRRGFEALEVSWRLLEAIDRRPELISKIVNLAGYRYHLGALRKAENVPAPWLERIRSVNPRQDILEGYREDLWTWVGMAQRKSIDDQSDMVPLTRYWHFPPFRLFARKNVAGIVDQYHRVFRDLLEQPHCGLDPSSERWRMKFPKWNVLGRVGAPDVADGWVRASLAETDLEFTEKIAVLKALRPTMKGGPRTSEIANRLGGSRYPEIGYRVEVLDDGRIRLSSSCDSSHLSDKIRMLPGEYVESGPRMR